MLLSYDKNKTTSQKIIFTSRLWHMKLHNSPLFLVFILKDLRVWKFKYSNQALNDCFRKDWSCLKLKRNLIFNFFIHIIWGYHVSVLD
ncbi:hypothetical protein BpHYR1_007320 [Brachionus plicatilis]|uniref:Uncharacterized protein n=1 Tax=Brachionus plicatilis TaxID=10195 RepID=A0A3M7QBQ6_BRAPC|nr:hypothetical protein BpHYR1_007320 [Brachionus plicatilis]